jgi:hypothetical protein
VPAADVVGCVTTVLLACMIVFWPASCCLTTP